MLTFADVKPNTAESIENSSTAQPLGPPPRPSQSGNDKGDYFTQIHGSSNNKNNTNGNNTNNKINGIGYHTEPNPFEEQFGNPATDTPGKLGLPPVASLTSPSSLMPNETPGWNSLRSGPLSPAMLAGPAGSDYFDQPFGRGFPTPNESSLRTGLTPGGGGSMFPAPSPGTAALFNSIALNTPNTIEFIRSGMTAKSTVNGSGPTSQPTESQAAQSLDLKIPLAPSDNAFDTSVHDTDAANGLFMLAQSNGARANTSFQGVSQPPTVQLNSATIAPSVQPVSVPSRNRKISVESSNQMDDQSDSDGEPPKPAPRGRKRGAATEPKAANNRRKATETPVKTPASKKARTSVAEKFEMSPDMDLDDEDDDDDGGNGKDTRKMTDEEKRKNFLERNR